MLIVDGIKVKWKVWVIRRIFIIIIDPPEKTNVMFYLVCIWWGSDLPSVYTDLILTFRHDQQTQQLKPVKNLFTLKETSTATTATEARRSQWGHSSSWVDVSGTILSLCLQGSHTFSCLKPSQEKSLAGEKRLFVCFCDCDLDSTHSCFLSADLRTAELSDKSSFIFKLGEFFHVEKKLNSRRKVKMFLCDAVKLFKAHLQSWNKLSSHHCDENKDWKHEGSS